jgi:hypothetical protein
LGRNARAPLRLATMPVAGVCPALLDVLSEGASPEHLSHRSCLHWSPPARISTGAAHLSDQRQVRVVLCLHPLRVSRTADKRLLFGPT